MKNFYNYLEGITKPSSLDCLVNLLSVYKAVALVHQDCHWKVCGSNFYGNHLLFERLYEAMQKNVDALAEKIIGYFGVDAFENSKVIDTANVFVRSWSMEEDLIHRAMMAESDLQKMIKYTYDTIKDNNEMHLGLDDFLMSLSEMHDGHLYLLNQAYEI